MADIIDLKKRLADKADKKDKNSSDRHQFFLMLYAFILSIFLILIGAALAYLAPTEVQYIPKSLCFLGFVGLIGSGFKMSGISV